MNRIVILGSGFGGLSCALQLAQKLEKKSGVAITLVDRHLYHLFTPNLFEVATAEEEFTSVLQLKKSIAFPIAEILSGTNVRFVRGELKEIDQANKKVILDHHHLDYDYLVLALGSQSEYHNIPGAEKFSNPLKTLADAFLIRNKLEFLLQAQQLSAAKQNVRIIIAGGGYTAVEFAGELRNFLEIATWKYNFPPEKVEVLMLEALPELMAGFDRRMSQKAYARLRDLGVRVELSTAITKTDEHFVSFIDGEKIRYDILVWTAGIRAVCPKFTGTVEQDKRGCVMTNEYLQAGSDENIFVVGDECRAADKTGRVAPASAQDAAHQGRYVAYALAKFLLNQKPRPYQHLRHGFIVNVSGKWAIMKVGWFSASGFIAYLADKYAHFRYYKFIVGFWKALRHVWMESEIYGRND